MQKLFFFRIEPLQAKFPSSILRSDPHGAFSSLTHFIILISEKSPVTIHRMFPAVGKEKKKKRKESARMGQRSPAHHNQRMSPDNQWHFYASRADSLLSLSGWWSGKLCGVECCGGKEIPIVLFRYPFSPTLAVGICWWSERASRLGRVTPWDLGMIPSVFESLHNI